MIITHKVGAFFAALCLVAALSAVPLQASTYPTGDFDPQRVYVVVQAVTLRSGPGTQFPAIGTLKAGQRVPVRGVITGFLKIPLQNGEDGYAWFEYLQEEGAASSATPSANGLQTTEATPSPTPTETASDSTSAPSVDTSPESMPEQTPQAPVDETPQTESPSLPVESSPVISATPAITEPPHPDMNWEHRLTARVMADERLYEPLDAIRAALKLETESLGPQSGVLIVGGEPFFTQDGKNALFVYSEKGGDFLPLLRAQGTSIRALTHTTNTWRDIEVTNGTHDTGESTVYTFTDNGYKPTRCFTYSTQNNNRMYQTITCPQ
ncbi:SH3 domain-containing protein [Desulfovibrio inopinatus]|uniref:SH3 domain-containing protein n=1 Tax=Desulfovibrio inopinatus TaxID=102109 RepID=UPI000409368B|nr:SH3 domain-containing protein [Desulfovibrio inopinatus]